MKELGCWARGLHALPNRFQPKSKASLHGTIDTENTGGAEVAVDTFGDISGGQVREGDREAAQGA